MTNQGEWSEFVDNLISNAIEEYKKTKEFEYRQQREKQIDEFLGTNLTVDEKGFVEEIIFELGVAAERETDIVYRQGLKDCVFILKSLGVLA